MNAAIPKLKYCPHRTNTFILSSWCELVKLSVSPGYDLPEQCLNPNQEEVQLHNGFMQDVDNNFQVFLLELDIFTLNLRLLEQIKFVITHVKKGLSISN